MPFFWPPPPSSPHLHLQAFDLSQGIGSWHPWGFSGGLHDLIPWLHCLDLYLPLLICLGLLFLPLLCQLLSYLSVHFSLLLEPQARQLRPDPPIEQQLCWAAPCNLVWCCSVCHEVATHHLSRVSDLHQGCRLCAPASPDFLKKPLQTH